MFQEASYQLNIPDENNPIDFIAGFNNYDAQFGLEELPTNEQIGSAVRDIFLFNFQTNRNNEEQNQNLNDKLRWILPSLGINELKINNTRFIDSAGANTINIDSDNIKIIIQKRKNGVDSYSLSIINKIDDKIARGVEHYFKDNSGNVELIRTTGFVSPWLNGRSTSEIPMAVKANIVNEGSSIMSLTQQALSIKFSI